MEERYSIGEVSINCNIPIKTLRYYDEIELLQPEYRNSESNYRYYSKEQMRTLLIIRRLRSQGFCLKDIKDLIEDTDLPNLQQKMEKRCEEISSEINCLEAKMESCQSILHRIKKGVAVTEEYLASNEAPESLIRIEEIPKGKMIFSRQIMKHYCNADVSLQRWTDIYEQCTALGIHMKSPIIVTYHNNVLEQFLMKDCDVEFGVLFGDEIELPTDALQAQTRDWGGMQAATTFHIGKYSEIMKSHVQLLRWINKNGYELDGPVSEKFIISPLDVNNESDHVTKIIMPIKKIES